MSRRWRCSRARSTFSELFAVGKFSGRAITRPDVACSPVEEGAEVGVPLVERPEEHALGAVFLFDPQFVRTDTLRVTVEILAQAVPVQPNPRQRGLAHAADRLEHKHRMVAVLEPIRKKLSLAGPPGEPRLQQMGVSKFGLARPVALGFACDPVLPLPIAQIDDNPPRKVLRALELVADLLTVDHFPEGSLSLCVAILDQHLRFDLEIVGSDVHKARLGDPNRLVVLPLGVGLTARLVHAAVTETRDAHENVAFADLLQTKVVGCPGAGRRTVPCGSHPSRRGVGERR